MSPERGHSLIRCPYDVTSSISFFPSSFAVDLPTFPITSECNWLFMLEIILGLMGHTCPSLTGRPVPWPLPPLQPDNSSASRPGFPQKQPVSISKHLERALGGGH